MNEVDWLTSKHPQGMLTFLQDCGRTSDRKVRLLAAACCRQMWHLFTDEDTRRAVKVAEWDIDGLTNQEVVGIAARGVSGGGLYPGCLPPAVYAPLHAARVALTAGRDTTGPRGATATTPVDALCTAM